MKHRRNTKLLDCKPEYIRDILKGFRVIFDYDRSTTEPDVDILHQYEGSEKDYHNFKYLLDFGNVAVILCVSEQ